MNPSISLFRFPLLSNDNIEKIHPNVPQNKPYLIVCRYYWNLTKNPKYLKLAIQNGSVLEFGKFGNYYESINEQKRAIKYYKMGVTYRDMKSIIGLALLYFRQNNKKCVYYLKLAFNNGNKEALLLLANFYEKTDFKRTEKYLKLAVNCNVKTANIRLGRLYESQNNMVEAEQCYLSEFENNNDLTACFLLANLYEKVEQYDKFIKLHQTNILKNNDVDSMIALGDFYNSDCENYSDESVAIKYYEMACDAGKPTVALIMFYLKNNDYEKLKKHYLNTIDKLNDETKGKILNKLANYEHVEGNMAQCIAFHDEAIQFGNAESMYDKAKIAQKNDNANEYIKYFELAVKNKCSVAIKNIEELNNFQHDLYKKQYETTHFSYSKQIEKLIEDDVF